MKIEAVEFDKLNCLYNINIFQKYGVHIKNQCGYN